MSTTQVKELATLLTETKGWEYESIAYRKELSYWLNRIRNELGEG